MSLCANVNEKANLIWAIADKLTGIYKPHEYGKVILPLMVIRRFDCILEETKQQVLKAYEQANQIAPSLREPFLKRASGYEFYNISQYTFSSLLNDSVNIDVNFKNYINGFSSNVREVIEKFKFDIEIQTMSDKNL
ncbi:type I restriction-modification system subunit M N-terminal domain-containing protein [uncultured Helicobacter sp.]|uniref:type I restriction-modification system subunit M N-terminal domain-containing protein n=1 Tax=uncultured Helicobacter sp. TaxID=175537 RepID=UPI0026029A64|nr:type I restriction-modification system subunit M N-terminal domain-containing protein [uncultured Helicobacter sp.]